MARTQYLYLIFIHPHFCEVVMLHDSMIIHIMVLSFYQVKCCVYRNCVLEPYQPCPGRLCHSSLQWRHNGCDGISDHRHLGCLLNRLFRRESKKTSKLCITAWSLWGIHRWPVHRWIPRTKGQKRGTCFHLMTPSCFVCRHVQHRVSILGAVLILKIHLKKYPELNSHKISVARIFQFFLCSPYWWPWSRSRYYGSD